MNTYFIQVGLRNPRSGEPMLTTKGTFKATPEGCLTAIDQLKKDKKLELLSAARQKGDYELMDQSYKADFVVLALAKLN